eukprot:gene39086-62708_t
MSMTRTLSRFLLPLASAAALLLGTAVQAQDRITFKVIGQPAATGMVQKNKE